MRFVPAVFRFYLFCLLLCGCDRGPDIVHMKVDRAEIAVPPREKDRMLVAMIPDGDDVWFFRMDGVESAVKEREPNFDAIVRTLKFDGKGETPRWQLPPDWTEEVGQKQFQLATLRPKDNPKGVVIGVSKLARKGLGGDVLANVNRWRGMLGLPIAKEEDLPQFTQGFDVDGRKGLLVDLRGRAGARPPMPQAPPPHNPADEGGNFKYDTPKGWAKVRPNNAIIREQLQVTEGDEKAEITVVLLPGKAGGIAENINRWRGQIKLARIDDPKQMAKEVVEINAGNHHGGLVDLVNTKAAAPNRILGVFIPTEDATLFLKMIGPDALVGRQKANFEAFVKSFTIAG